MAFRPTGAGRRTARRVLSAVAALAAAGAVSAVSAVPASAATVKKTAAVAAVTTTHHHHHHDGNDARAERLGHDRDRGAVRHLHLLAPSNEVSTSNWIGWYSGSNTPGNVASTLWNYTQTGTTTEPTSSTGVAAGTTRSAPPVSPPAPTRSTSSTTMATP